MKTYILSIIIIFSHLNLFAQTEENANLFLCTLDEKKGFINADGKEIIPCQFDDVKRFSEGLIAVNEGAVEVDYELKGGKWGFMNSNGKWIIPFQYEDAKYFRNGIAPVKKDGKYGFVNKKNEVVIDFQYEDANPFFQELAAVKKNGKWGFINRKGKIIIEPAYGKVNDFEHNLSAVYNLRGEYEVEDDGYIFKETYGTYGMIDREGKLVLDTIFDYINKFENGFARIELERKEGFVDSTGKIVIPLDFDTVDDFSEGFAAVGNYMMRDSYHDFGYSKKQIDSLQKEIDVLFENATEENYRNLLNNPTYQEYSRATMQMPSEKLTFGYIDKKGEVVIDFKFDRADPFLGGLAYVKIGPDQIISFVELDSLGNELSNAQDQKGLGANIINTAGEFQFEKNARYINRGEDDVFVTSNFKGTGAVDEHGKTIIENQYQNLKYLGNGLFVAEPKRIKIKKLINSKNEVIIESDKIWRISRLAKNRLLIDYIMAKKGRSVETKQGIIDEAGKWILRPKYELVFKF